MMISHIVVKVRSNDELAEMEMQRGVLLRIQRCSWTINHCFTIGTFLVLCDYGSHLVSCLSHYNARSTVIVDGP